MSWVVGTLGLTVILGISLLTSRARPFARLEEPARKRLRVVAGVAVTMQAAHFVEELRTGFPQAFPSILGLRPWSTAAFVLFNIGWLAIWMVALREAPRGRRLAEWPLWFLGLAMMVNGVAHPLLAVRAGGYFPGLWTSIPSAVVGVMLLRELTRISGPRGALP